MVMGTKRNEQTWTLDALAGIGGGDILLIKEGLLKEVRIMRV